MSFVKVFKINVSNVIIYRKGSVSKVNVSKGNELKGKVPKKSVSSKLNSLIQKDIRSKYKTPSISLLDAKEDPFSHLVYLKRLENCFFLSYLYTAVVGLKNKN